MARTVASDRARRARERRLRLGPRSFAPGTVNNSMLRPYVAAALFKRARATGLLSSAMFRWRRRQNWPSGRRRWPVGTPLEAKALAVPHYSGALPVAYADRRLYQHHDAYRTRLEQKVLDFRHPRYPNPYADSTARWPDVYHGDPKTY